MTQENQFSEALKILVHGGDRYHQKCGSCKYSYEFGSGPTNGEWRCQEPVHKASGYTKGTCDGRSQWEIHPELIGSKT